MLAELNEGTLGILDLIQQSIPLVPRPFEAIGEKLGMSEEQVIDEIGKLKSKPTSLIRQISAIFDSRSLGYKSSLVAAKVDPAQIDHAAQMAGIFEHALRVEDFACTRDRAKQH